jgi:tape measure domain-containing protein
MALNVGELYAKLKLDLTDFNKGIKDVQKQLTSIGNNKAFDVFSTKAVNALTKIGNMQARIYKQMNDNLKLKTQLAIANMSKEEAAEQRKHQLKMAQIQKEIALKAQQTQLAISLIRKESDAFKAESARKAQADRNLTQERIANLRAWERISAQTARSYQSAMSQANRAIANAERQRIQETRNAERNAYQQRKAELQQLGAVVGAGYATGASRGNVFQTMFSMFSVSSVISGLQMIFATTLSGIQSVGNVLFQETSKYMQYNADIEMSFESLRFLILDTGENMAKTYNIINETGEMDKPFVSASLLAGELYEGLRKLSIESPTLQFQDVVQGATRLKNAGVAAEELERTIKAIGDGAAVTGKDAMRNFDRATYAIGQMYQKGGIYAEEFRKQLGNTGIATFSALEAATGLSQSTLAGLMDRGLLKNKTTLNELSKATNTTVKEIAKALGDETLTGDSTVNWVDKYIEGLEKVRGGAMLELADTWTGVVNIMNEEWKFFTMEVSKPLFFTLKDQLKNFLSTVKATFSDGNMKGKMSEFFGSIGVMIAYVNSSLLPPLLDSIEKLVNLMTSNSVPFLLEFKDSIDALEQSLPNIVANIGGFFGGIFDIFSKILSDLPNIIETITSVISQLPAILSGVYSVMETIVNSLSNILSVFSLQWLTGDAATLTDQLEVLAQTVIMLTAVFVILKAVMAAATLLYFVKQIALARAGYNALSLSINGNTGAIGGNTAAVAANTAATLIAQASALREQATKIRSMAIGEMLTAGVNRETAARIANTLATQMETTATDLDAMAQGVGATATNTNAGAKVKLAAANTVAAGSFRALFAAMGPISIGLAIISAIAIALVPAFIDFGDAAEQSGEDTKSAFDEAAESVERTQELIDNGLVNKTMNINVLSTVKGIDFTKLPNYNADGTIQGPDVVVRVLTAEQVAEAKGKMLDAADTKRIKELEDKIQKNRKTLQQGTGRGAMAAGKNISQQQQTQLRADNKKMEEEIAQIRKNPTQAKATFFDLEAEASIGRMGTLNTALQSVRKEIGETEYKKIRDEIIAQAAGGQKFGLDKIAADMIAKTRQAVSAGKKFTEQMYPKTKKDFLALSNYGQVLQEVFDEGYLGNKQAEFDKVMKEAVYGANPKIIRNRLTAIDKKAADVYVRRVLLFDAEAFTREYTKTDFGGIGDISSFSTDEANDFDTGGGGGTKPLSPYEKMKRTAEHLKAMGKSAKEVYSKWKEAQALAYKEVDADQGLANFRESQEKMLDILNEAEKEKTKKIEDWQSIQEKALEKSYKNRKDALDKYYRDIDDKEDVAKLQEEKRRLEIERTFYAGATSAEGISKLAEIDSKMRDNKKAIDKKNREITKQNEEDALEKGKETAEKLISSFANTKIGALDDRNKTSTAYIDWIDFVYKNVTDKKPGFVADFQKDFPMKQGTFESTSSGTGTTTKANTGSSTTTSNKTLEWLQSKGIISTYKMPEMPKATEAKTAYAGASYGFANPMGQLVAAGGTVNNFNGALVNVNTMYVRDDQDVANIGKEMFRTAQRAATAQGGRI